MRKFFSGILIIEECEGRTYNLISSIAQSVMLDKTLPEMSNIYLSNELANFKIKSEQLQYTNRLQNVDNILRKDTIIR